VCRWALDSGGFTELFIHGRWVTPAAAYVEAVDHYAERIGGMDFAAPQDWMCEPVMIERTGHRYASTKSAPWRTTWSGGRSLRTFPLCPSCRDGS
jgi:hypothetical protein